MKPSTPPSFLLLALALLLPGLGACASTGAGEGVEEGAAAGEEGPAADGDAGPRWAPAALEEDPLGQEPAQPLLMPGQDLGEAVETPTALGSPRPGDEVAYAAYARERAARLDTSLAGLLRVTMDAVREVRASLEADLAAIPKPLVLAARDRQLRAWRAGERAAFQEAVGDRHERARAELQAIYEQAMEAAIERAQAMAVERSPLDAGPTGEPLLDRELVVFEETLRDAFDLPGLDAQGQLDVLSRIELVEIFNSFVEEGADQALAGRLLLFVGGPELGDGPRVRVVLRLDEGVDPGSRRLYQGARYRVMRGDTLVQDLGWRPMPPGDGWASTEVHAERYLVGEGLAPRIDQEAPAFEQLRDMRVVVDLQTAVVDSGPAGPEVLGGVDWRIEFRITFRGVVSWQLTAASPIFDESCAEVRRLLRL